MVLPIFQVDAFATELFRGNPAAVCPLSEWLPDKTMQAIAAENNLAETAFFVRNGSSYALRWFTPAIEVPLCGHATLASAFVIFEYLDPSAEGVHFTTASGELSVTRAGKLLAMDLPRYNAEPCPPPDDLIQGLVRVPREVRHYSESDKKGNYLAIYDSEEDVRLLQPELAFLGRLARHGVIVTAPGDNADFVSRYFAPAIGIPEDPVTGSAHCVLVPYWAERLSKKQFHAQQISPRGGELLCQLEGERVILAGKAVCFLRGSVLLPDAEPDSAPTR
jgi:predicted PhzF superfamily epimerase YddE/YHI9